MNSDNSEQIEFWNGSVATNWVAAEERMNELLAGLSQHVIERATPQSGEMVLDVGCGCGGTSLAIAAAGARVLGIDVSAPMLERARQHAHGNDRVDFIEADAARHTFEPEFDLLFSRFGVMFFADPVAAFANLRRSLKAAGRLCFVCWQDRAENGWLAIPMRAAQPFLPEAEAPDPRAPGPFAFADSEYLTRVLGDGGFTDVAVEPHHVDMRVGANLDEAMQFFCEVGPFASALGQLEPPNRDAALAAVRQALAPMETRTGVVLPGGCWIATARR